MVSLYRAPKYERKGPKLEPYQIILRPMITEKATRLSERQNTYTFEVNSIATKTEIKEAIQTLFDVQVATVRTQNRKGITKRFRLKMGTTRNYKKAIVELKSDYRIDFY
jgi:large subunit ribosomal protein L23